MDESYYDAHMTYAVAIGAAGYPHFVELNICLVRDVLGKDTPVVVCDDYSQDSPQIERVAAKRDCFYMRNDVPLGHFQGDVQAFIHALSLAEVEKRDIALKLSQRCSICSPDVKAIVEAAFLADDKISVVCPGRPDPRRIRKGHEQFARFPILTDIVFMKANSVSPEFIKEAYLQQVRNGKAYHDCFVEVFFWNLKEKQMPNRVHLCPALTDHRGGQPPLYLRRYQNTQLDYQRYGDRYGIHPVAWELEERVKLTKRYDPRPKAF